MFFSAQRADSKACWDVLPQVSRSFSLCIQLLDGPMREQMMVSYLVYRVIDTIEDSSAPLLAKKRLFQDFISLLRAEKYDGARTEEVRQSLLTQLNYTYEKSLLEALHPLVREYFQFEAHVRKPILQWGRVMAKGMFEFQKKKISTFADQDRYSYYVAGVVGYLFNDLLAANQIINETARRRLRYHARRFGQALQKVNILRDVANDVPAGRHYWPRVVLQKYELDYPQLLASENRAAAMKVLREEIVNALDYLYSGMYYTLSLPKSAIRVRMFCLIPLFMAIESYLACINNKEIFDNAKTVKISRLQVQDIVSKSTLWGSHNERLVAWFDSSMAPAQPLMAKASYARHLQKMKMAAVETSAK